MKTLNRKTLSALVAGACLAMAGAVWSAGADDPAQIADDRGVDAITMTGTVDDRGNDALKAGGTVDDRGNDALKAGAAVDDRGNDALNAGTAADDHGNDALNGGSADVRREDRRDDRMAGADDSRGGTRAEHGMVERAEHASSMASFQRPEKVEAPQKIERVQRPEKIEVPQKIERVQRPEKVETVRGGGHR